MTDRKFITMATDFNGSRLITANAAGREAVVSALTGLGYEFVEFNPEAMLCAGRPAVHLIQAGETPDWMIDRLDRSAAVLAAIGRGDV